MASNLDYLAPNLLPLEEKVRAFLDTEKALQRAQVAQINDPQPANAASLSAQQASDTPPNAVQLRAELARLEDEIIDLLPTRNEWLKVNLGYGPSRVGAWHVPAGNGAAERYELRVVH